MFFKDIFKIFKIKELRKKVLVVLLIFIVFRVMANIPIPGVDSEKLKVFFERFQVFGLVNIFSGGTLQNLSIIMLGLGPYITSTVVLQLLSMVFPQLEKIYKEEGEAGKEKFNQYGRILTIPLAMLQAYAMLTLFEKQGVISNLSPLMSFASIISVAAGTIFLMWLGEIITDKGIGNGTSLLIFAGIISRMPRSFLETYAKVKLSSIDIKSTVVFSIISLIMIFAVVVVTQAKRNTPIAYAKRVRGRKVYGGARTYLPLNINPAGVMPIIFALSILTFPGMIANFFVDNQGLAGSIARTVSQIFQNTTIYSIFYFVLVFIFTFFYTMVIFDPKTIADNLKKMGGFVPGHRPGEPTAKFIGQTINHILPIGATFLAIIAIMPSITSKITSVNTFQFLAGGTSLMILVSVILETYQEINAYFQMQEL